MPISVSDRKILAYRRENGRVGVRNHVIILPVDDISNACVEKVAAMVPGTMALPHAYGRLQFGEDLDLFFDHSSSPPVSPSPSTPSRVLLACLRDSPGYTFCVSRAGPGTQR